MEIPALMVGIGIGAVGYWAYNEYIALPTLAVRRTVVPRPRGAAAEQIARTQAIARASPYYATARPAFRDERFIPGVLKARFLLDL